MRILQRGVHALSVVTAVTLGGAVLFFVLGCVALRFEDYDSEVKWASVALGVILLTLVVWGIWKKISYRVVLPVIGLCGGFVLYLVWDDAESPPAPDVGPVVPADSKSYETYRWFVKGDPNSRLGELSEHAAELPRFPDDHAQWPVFFAQHREVFTEAWEKDTLGRAWIEAMALHRPEAMFPPAERMDNANMVFSPVRLSARGRWGYAQVLMLDQQHDDAARLLLPFLRASYNLQRGGPTLVSEMIAVVCIRGAFDQLEILAESGKLSPEVRSEIMAVLNTAPPLQTVFRNAFLGEQVQFRLSMMETKGDYSETIEILSSLEGSKIPTVPFLSRLFFNPYRSAREYGDILEESRHLAESRRLESADVPEKGYKAWRKNWPVKNPIGRLAKQTAPIALRPFITISWEAEDRRVALLKLLETP